MSIVCMYDTTKLTLLMYYFLQGEFEFTDGLQYVIEDDWPYCDGRQHREFKSEIENGIKPAGNH